MVILEIETIDLSKGWDAKPSIDVTQYTEDDFVRQDQALILKVPSCIVPQEINFLINPRHKDIVQISVTNIQPLRFDSRIS